jgi:hypothetical protein
MEINRFAWLPTKMTSGKLVWFSTYIEHKELYDRHTGRAPVTRLYFTWTETAQEKTWRLLKETAIQNRNIWNDPNLTKEDKL